MTACIPLSSAAVQSAAVPVSAPPAVTVLAPAGLQHTAAAQLNGGGGGVGGVGGGPQVIQVPASHYMAQINGAQLQQQQQRTTVVTGAVATSGQPVPISWQQPQQPIVAQGLINGQQPATIVQQAQPQQVPVTQTIIQAQPPQPAAVRVQTAVPPPLQRVVASTSAGVAPASATVAASSTSSSVAAAVSAAATAQSAAGKLMEPRQLSDLAKQLDPSLQLDDEVSDLMLELADDFVDAVAHQACQLAKHRGSSVLEAKDVALVVERHYGIEVPGFGLESSSGQRAPKKLLTTEAHRQRLMLIKKAMKKH